MSVAELIVAGDVRATARLLRDIDDQIPSARDILRAQKYWKEYLDAKTDG